MTNLINLIDGVDGLASGICLMLMALLAYVGHQNGSFELTASGMAGALVGFLFFNFPPARIYLGDGGAYFLGFQIGFLSLVGSHKGTVVAALVAPLFVLALPIVDTSIAILRRGLRGLPIFRPDRRHIHHRLLEMGFSRRKAVLSIYGITVLFLLMGFLVFVSRGDLAPALLGITVIILLVCAGKLNFSREWFAVGRVLGNSLEMRQEIQYALSLTRWLGLEGARHNSLESLWGDLVFAAQRLGFCSVSLTLSDETRVWHTPEFSEPTPTQIWRHALRGGNSGVLELKAPAANMAQSLKRSSSGTDDAEMKISDPKLFEILSELLAEGWLTAIRRHAEKNPPPLSFLLKKEPAETIEPLRPLPAANDLLTPNS
jgi:UDP-GlcNAc:undecaprenyl-phosphate GlcNAc-1-phosphate transferase